MSGNANLVVECVFISAKSVSGPIIRFPLWAETCFPLSMRVRGFSPLVVPQWGTANAEIKNGSPGPEKDEINVPIALSAFRDNSPGPVNWSLFLNPEQEYNIALRNLLCLLPGPTHFCLPGSMCFIFYKTSPSKDCEMSGTANRLSDLWLDELWFALI